MKLGKAFKRTVKGIARNEGRVLTQGGKIVTQVGKGMVAASPLVTAAGVATGNPALTAAGVSMGAAGTVMVPGGRMTKNYGRVIKHKVKGKDASKPAGRGIKGAFSTGRAAIEQQQS